MGDNNKKLCPYCKGAVQSGKKCPKCCCLFHNSCADRQPKNGKWQCCHKSSNKHALLDSTRFNGSNFLLSSSLLQPSTSTTVTRDESQADSSFSMDVSQGEASAPVNKQEQLSPIPSPVQNNTPASEDQQLTGVTLQQISSMLASEIQRQNQGIFNRIDSLASQIAVVDNRVQPIAELAERVDNIDSRVAALESRQQAAPPLPNIDNIAAEIRDRLQRSQNIIIYGVLENIGAPHTTDLESVTSLLTRVPGINLTNIVARRLGKPKADGTPRPLLVTLVSASEVQRILRNRHVLPRPVSVSTDKTQAERAHLKGLIEQVAAHNAANPNDQKKIKYVNGVPTIVDARPLRRSQEN